MTRCDPHPDPEPGQRPLVSRSELDGPRSVRIPSGVKDPSLFRFAVDRQYRYSRVGLAVGCLCILAGLLLLLHGISGSVSWTAQLMHFTSKLVDAPAGIVLAVLGLAVVWITRFEVR